jgi:tRNA dimethylallyltransferase
MENIIPDFDFLKLGIMPERSILYERINNRCEEMITRGLIDETKKLLEKYGNEQQAFQAIGYSHIIRLINHEFDENELIRLFKRDTRRFAKRQFTLFKTFSNVNWISNINITEIEKKINDFLVL